MKKLLLIPFSLIFALSCKKETYMPPPAGGFLADDKPCNRNVVLEEVSGVLCWWTPTGHVISRDIIQANPGRVFRVSIHASSYAGPNGNYPNFRTELGNSLYNLMGNLGIPSATLNRMNCADLGVTPMSRTNSISIDRSGWVKATEAALKQTAPVNLGILAKYDASTRILSVDVEMYYTRTDTIKSNLHVYLLQDKLFGKQRDLQTDIQSYEQSDVLRDKLTSSMQGEIIIQPTIKGYRFKRSFTYQVPEDYNGTGANGGGAVVIENLKVLAFVAHGQTDIQNAAQTRVK